MNHSTSIGALAKALSIVQGKLQPAIKDAKNPFFKSSYSSLNSVWDSCRALLSENGLSVAQLNQTAENGVIIETVLMHESGEWISGEMFLPLAKHDPQGVGSATSYGRRYGLAAIVGIVTDDDDDGNAASQPKQIPAHKATEQQKAKPATDTIGKRIENAIGAIQGLGGKVEAIAQGESEQDYFESLVEQYNRLAKGK
ncbi:MAG: ERF family protein [Acidobacteriota bacterium]|nr:ERF family protein [Acidobacteriota bacterium]